MSITLPSTVEELNLHQPIVFDTLYNPSLYRAPPTKGADFSNIFVEKRYKREYSLPSGTDWNISDFDPYLNFEENLADPVVSKAIESALEDRLVPEEDQRLRCGSISSVASSMDERPDMFQNYGVKSFSTVHMDSGSTCISSDHSYVSNSGGAYFKSLEAEETYQNLEMFIQGDTNLSMSENIPSPLSSSDSNFELSTLQSFSLPRTGNQDTLDKYAPLKRPAESPSNHELYGMNPAKKMCDSPVDPVLFTESRRKNNVAAKNCRKTRKEKQKDMEIRVVELEKEREGLKVEVQMLEEMIQRHKMQLYAILPKRS